MARAMRRVNRLGEGFMRRLLVSVLGALVLAGGAAAAAVGSQAPPVPEHNFATTLTPTPCAATTPYEAAEWRAEGWKGTEPVRYPGKCQRLHFAFGPIHVKPGQNDVL